LYRLFKGIIGPAFSLVGFIFFAFYLPLWIIAQKADPDGLNVLLVAATLFILYRISNDAPKKYYLYLGIIYGIQLLVRPDVLMGMIIFGLWLLVPKDGRLERLKWYLVSVVVALLIILPWTIRNYSTFGSFVLVSANSGYNFYMGNNPNATGEMFQEITTEEGAKQVDSIKTFFRSHESDVEKDAFLYSIGKQWAFSHPLDAVALGFKKFYMHWWHRENAGSEVASKPWMIIGYKVASIYLLIFGFIGLFSIRQTRLRTFFLSLFLYSTLISVIFFVQSRHRALKVDPSLIYLSVAGLGASGGKIFTTKQEKTL
jgi:4-amino-4-deoxy-L-arabinose transferase-like glycosyltransferase